MAVILLSKLFRLKWTYLWKHHIPYHENFRNDFIFRASSHSLIISLAPSPSSNLTPRFFHLNHFVCTRNTPFFKSSFWRFSIILGFTISFFLTTFLVIKTLQNFKFPYLVKFFSWSAVFLYFLRLWNFLLFIIATFKRLSTAELHLKLFRWSLHYATGQIRCRHIHDSCSLLSPQYTLHELLLHCSHKTGQAM